MQKEYEEEGYGLEELLPIVTKLAGRYTSYESTSVTYETAGKLMEAVQFCIRMAQEQEAGAVPNPPKMYPSTDSKRKKILASDAYETGVQKILQKVKDAKEQYNLMIVRFCDYGNKNYGETVKKAIPGFFRYYDVRFAPQETLITMDYPTLSQLHVYQGIEAIERYIECICLEQEFLEKLPMEYIVQILNDYDGEYQNQFYNICRIVLRHVLGCMMIQKPMGLPATEEDYYKLQGKVDKMGKEATKKLLEKLLKQLMCEKYENNKEMYDYLKKDLADFVTELFLTKEYERMHEAVTLG